MIDFLFMGKFARLISTCTKMFGNKINWISIFLKNSRSFVFQILFIVILVKFYENSIKMQ